MLLLVLLLSTPVFAENAYERMDADRVIFGYEATFQNRTMANEKGDEIFSTPHKLKKIEEFENEIVKQLGPLKNREDDLQEDFKPWVDLKFTNEKVLLTIEPGIIEANQRPKTYPLRKR